MQYYTCKCGQMQAWGSMGPSRCAKCDKCGTGYGYGDGTYPEPLEHDFSDQHEVETDEGMKPLSTCKYCHYTRRQIEKMRMKESQAARA